MLFVGLNCGHDEEQLCNVLCRDRISAGKQRIQRIMIVRKETLKLQFCHKKFEGDDFWCVIAGGTCARDDVS